MSVLSQSKNAAAVGSGGTSSAASTSAAAAAAAPARTCVTASSSGVCCRLHHMIQTVSGGARSPFQPPLSLCDRIATVCHAVRHPASHRALLGGVFSMRLRLMAVSAAVAAAAVTAALTTVPISPAAASTVANTVSGVLTYADGRPAAGKQVELHAE